MEAVPIGWHQPDIVGLDLGVQAFFLGDVDKDASRGRFMNTKTEVALSLRQFQP